MTHHNLRSHHPIPPRSKAQSRHGKKQSAQNVDTCCNRACFVCIPRCSPVLCSNRATHSHSALQFPHAILLLAISSFLPAKSISFTWNPWPWIVMDYILAEMGDTFETEVFILSPLPSLLSPSFLIFFGTYATLLIPYLSDSYSCLTAKVLVTRYRHRATSKQLYEQLHRFSLGVRRGAYRFLVEKPEGKKPLGRP